LAEGRVDTYTSGCCGFEPRILASFAPLIQPKNEVVEPVEPKDLEEKTGQKWETSKS